MKTYPILVVFPLVALSAIPCLAQRIQPEDLVYEGAFRLPEGSGGSDWAYSGNALTYYPYGDPDGPDDGYPGSLFGTGSDAHQFVSEISIPIPVVSPGHAVGDLNTATTLQPFSDVFGGVFDYLEIPVTGLAYLPSAADATTGKLHFCRGQHIQYDEPTHGWIDLSLEPPAAAGPWHLGPHNNYTTSDYLFDVPVDWASRYAPGQLLASGRFREGVWSGFGPALYVYQPFTGDTPPPPGSQIENVTPLLLYGLDDPAIPEIVTQDTMSLDGYNMDDFWTGAAWLTSGDRSAVVFAGVKGQGDAWYGFSDGTVWPYEGPYPEIPAPPHDARGFWADSISAQMLFYDTDDLGAVAEGRMMPHQPQPYATFDLDPYLFDGPGYHYARYKDWSLGAAAFDRANRRLYVMEHRVQDDEEKSLVHVWRIDPAATGTMSPQHTDETFALAPVFPNPASSTVEVAYRLSERSALRLVVYDVLGRPVHEINTAAGSAGSHREVIDISPFPAGVYIIRLETVKGTRTQRLVVMK